MERPGFHKRVLLGSWCCFYFESVKLVAIERKDNDSRTPEASPSAGNQEEEEDETLIISELPAGSFVAAIFELDNTETSPVFNSDGTVIEIVDLSIIEEPTINITGPTPPPQTIRMSSPRRYPQQPTLSTTPIPPSLLPILLNKIHSTFSHARYAIAGLTSLTLHNYPNAHPSRITVLTGYDSYESLRSWASTAGWYLSSSERDILAIPLENGEYRGIVLKLLDESYLSSIETVVFHKARVVGLEGMLELRLGAWLGMTSSSSPEKIEEEIVRDCERQIRWIIGKLERLNRKNVPCLGVARLWEGFFCREGEEGLREKLRRLGVSPPVGERETRIIEERVWTGRREIRVFTRSERDNTPR
ncbi:hypothetical protein QBC38DRAFT_530579 [Podospora fimiseda]|uniref:Uncharacterized protein n=1 Tax=Podospora fimiseda TaxID=252190 RepID=A0AAN7BXF5_9PEZI|nr:hypothetical protein QBC38DRAFT_530579 [Podospora fimiseda]